MAEKFDYFMYIYSHAGYVWKLKSASRNELSNFKLLLNTYCDIMTGGRFKIIISSVNERICLDHENLILSNLYPIELSSRYIEDVINSVKNYFRRNKNITFHESGKCAN